MSRFENVIAAIIGLISIPVMLLNFGGAIIGGIWLAILGNWGLLGVGLFSSSFRHLASALPLCRGSCSPHRALLLWRKADM